MPNTNQQDHHHNIDQIGQEFVSQWRLGENPGVEQYAQTYPELADEIRQLFPAMLFAEQLNPLANSSPRMPELQLPAQLSEFTLLREIGRGGMGIVYEATQPHFAQRLAVKVLQHRGLTPQRLNERFTREAEAASRLHHPNIVPPRQYGTEDQYHFLAMALVDGISLDRLIDGIDSSDTDDSLLDTFNQLRSNWTKIAKLGADVASALSHAHGKGMIHRDMKPANLILDRAGTIWVTDFGLAKIFDDDRNLSLTGEMVGTPRYMAPEQLIGAADARSDVYGIGLTLYELATGKRPWVATEQRGQLSTHSILEMPDIRSLDASIPTGLARIIMKACEHHPEARYQTAEELRIELNEFAFCGKSNRRTSVPHQDRVSQWKKRGLCVSLICVLVCVLTGKDSAHQPARTRLPINGITQTASPSIPTPNSIPISSVEHERHDANCKSFVNTETGLTHVLTRISYGADDAEQYGEGIMYLESSDLELTWDEYHQIIGMRFAGVQVPRGAIIRHADITFESQRTDIGKTSLRLYGIDDADPPGFGLTDYDISNRDRTPELIHWEPKPWSRGELHATPDCSLLVQKIINRDEWRAGNAMGFIIDGEGGRTAGTYEANIHTAPLLTIQYELPPDQSADVSL